MTPAAQELISADDAGVPEVGATQENHFFEIKGVSSGGPEDDFSVLDAALVTRGRKVLFGAEKRAAILHRRLRGWGREPEGPEGAVVRWGP